MPRKTTKAEQIARISPAEISKLKGREGRDQLVKYVQTLQAGYRRRVASFKRQGEFSYAQHAIEKTFTPGSHGKISDMSLNKLRFEFARYSSFFQDETSTLRGIRKVNREQDIKIFGVDKKGKPLNTLTSQQRIDYWSLYEEYMKQNPVHSLASGQVQRLIGSSEFLPKPGEEFDIQERIDKIKEEFEGIRRANELEESMPNVYMGRGPFVPK